MTGAPDLRTVLAVATLAAIVIGGYAASRAVSRALRRHGAAPSAVRGVPISVSIVIVLLVLGVLYAYFGPLPSISGLTVSAVAGLVLTLALQTTIGNVIAGYILLRNGVLRIGDKVQISGVHGRVVRLGPVTTWLRLEDGALASVSNSTLLSGPLINQSVGERLKGEY
ncbi:MAG: mechanosensitive ion channel family protein [Thermoplasmata archaeon]|nr:mechanosensitive ion channel family protein [Thermoplasmata archaeon]